MLGGGGAWWWASGRELRDAQRRLPEILAQGERGDRHAFYRDARKIIALLPDEPRLQQLWTNNTLPITVRTQPPGADVFVRSYSAPDDEWAPIGQTPLEGAMINAIDPRSKANVLLGGGLARSPMPPEIDALNFAPRVQAPTLMVNGDGDFQSPLTSTQLPLFRLLGPQPDRKRHALFQGGHMPVQIHEVMREILDWFDRYLGPVTPLSDR